MSAREEMLTRIRTALGAGRASEGLSATQAAEGIPRRYRTAGSTGEDVDLLELLEDRLRDYKAGVRRASAADVGAAVAEALETGVARRDVPAGAGAAGGTDAAGAAPRLRVVVPVGLPDALRAGIDGQVVVDDALPVEELDGVDAVVTAATVAVAETGTIVLDGSPDQGRRAITLVPDVHVCVVRAAHVVADVPDAMPLLDPRRPLTWISGPSATSDIELERVEGVHGPRILEVVLVEG